MTYPQEKKEENLDNPTVFKITNSEISKTAVTQCKVHKWEKLNDKEIYCPVCQSAAIVENPADYAKPN